MPRTAPTGDDRQQRRATGRRTSSAPRSAARIAMLESELRRCRTQSSQTETLGQIGRWELDLATQSVRWSDGMYRIFGLGPGSPVTLDVAASFYLPDGRKQIAKEIAALAATAGAFDSTLPFVSADGRSGWVRVLGQIETEADGSRRLVGAVREVSEEREAERQLRSLAYDDPLTGLANRRSFQERLTAALAADDAPAVALFLLDVDNFKTVNDLHGHRAGDKLLQEVARRMGEAVRTTDTIARIGGDEFAVIIPGIASEARVTAKAAALLEVVRGPIRIGSKLITASISLGVALNRGQPLAAEELLKRADIALREAKELGRNRACVFRKKLHDRIEEHSRTLDDVHAALAQGQLEVFYQPIIDLRTQVVRGLEALVRWRHPRRGMLLPGAFSAALSDPALSVEIDDFVLCRSVEQTRQWLNDGVPVACTAVNVSEAQLRRPDLAPRITSLLDQHGLTPDRLKLEVLETAFLGLQADRIADSLRRLADFGVISALDDFGTGYASLTHLKQFKIGRIKIDRSFVANICTSSFDHAITKSIIDLGINLGLRVTAEGVETVEQLALLRQLGCDCAQGYLLGRPLAAGDVPAFLVEWYAGRSLIILGPLDDGTARSSRRRAHARSEPGRGPAP